MSIRDLPPPGSDGLMPSPLIDEVAEQIATLSEYMRAIDEKQERDKIKTMQKVITLDTETTGIDPKTSEVIELCIKSDDGVWTWRFRPSVQVSAEAEAVHGISNADLAEEQTFKELEAEVLCVLMDCDVIVGYNVMFDIDMLEAQFLRGQYVICLTDKIIVDPYLIWRAQEPRSLSDAHKRFTGMPLSGAHAAEVDVHAADAVLTGMLQEFDLSDLSWTQLQDIGQPDRMAWVGGSNHFIWVDGVATLNFGKHKGKPMSENTSYLKWMQGQSFPVSVGTVLTRFFNDELLSRRGVVTGRV